MMTRLERALVAIGHRKPERVLIDFGAVRSTGISAVAYSRLKKFLGIAACGTYVYDDVMQGLFFFSSPFFVSLLFRSCGPSFYPFL